MSKKLSEKLRALSPKPPSVWLEEAVSPSHGVTVVPLTPSMIHRFADLAAELEQDAYTSKAWAGQWQERVVEWRNVACGLAFDHGRLQEEHRELQAAHDHFVEAAVRLSCGDVAGTRREFCLAMHGDGCPCAEPLTADATPGPATKPGR